MRAALSYLGHQKEHALADPPSPTFALWVADEGWLYPPTLHHTCPVPLSQLLLVKTGGPEDVWRIGLESLQTGLFQWIFLRPSKACSVAALRKLQLTAERTQTQVFVLGNLALPHWVLKKRHAGTLSLSFGPSGPLQ